MGGRAAEGGSFRARVHQLLRESILEEATRRATEMPWSQVRVADLAEAVGVSRQTIHNEFGTKDQLAAAVFEREMHFFQQGVVERMEQAATLAEGVGSALTWLLDAADDHPLLSRILTEARRDGGENVPTALTVHADRILLPMRAALTEVCDRRWPASGDFTERMIDVCVRLAITFMLAPPDKDRAVMVRTVVDLVVGAAHGPAATIGGGGDTVVPAAREPSEPSATAPGDRGRAPATRRP